MTTAAESPTARPRVLVLANTRFFPPFLEELAQPRPGRPRAWISDVDAELEAVDQRLTTNPPRWRRALYRRLPMWVVQVLEAHRVGPQYDVVFCWSVADVTLVLSLLRTVTRRRLRVVALLTRVSESKKARLLRRVHPRIDRIILPPVVQREFAVQALGVPADKLVGLPWTLDAAFWSAGAAGDAWVPEGLTISAAGGEMRDYATLVRAMEGTGIPCHIAGVLDTARPDWWNADERDRRGEDHVPSNVTFGTMPADELRALYARSRLVVVPLRPTDSDNGITCMNEAWAMGRPVIVSAVEGQRGAFVEGREGLWVPPGDPVALRRAILELWHDPARAAAMGAAGRRLVEEGRDHRVFSEGVSRVLREVTGLRAPAPAV
jgi:glycosyltransferase involved in cell wall biosynthesis